MKLTPTAFFLAALTVSAALSLQAADREPERKELWVPAKNLDKILKDHPNAVLLDREQYEALIRDAGKMKPDETNQPPVKSVIESAKIHLDVTSGDPMVKITAKLSIILLVDGWAEAALLQIPDSVRVLKVDGKEIGAWSSVEYKLALHGKGRHEVSLELQSPVMRQNGICRTEIPLLCRPFSVTVTPHGNVKLSERWPVHDGVAEPPLASEIPHGNKASLTWEEVAPAGSLPQSVLRQNVSSITRVDGGQALTDVRMDVASTSGPLPDVLRFDLPDENTHVISVSNGNAASSASVASWTQNGTVLEINRSAGLATSRTFLVHLTRPAPDGAKTGSLIVDVPRLNGAGRITADVVLGVGAGLEMKGWQIPAASADNAFQAEAVKSGTINGSVRYEVAPEKIIAVIRRTGDHFSADVDALIALSTHEMTIDRTLAFRGEEGRVNRTQLTLPVNEQFIALTAAGGEAIEWKQIESSAPIIEITWPNGLQKGASSTLLLKTRQDISTKANSGQGGEKLAVENVRLGEATRVAGYVALNFDESWKVATQDTTGMESRDARTTPVTGKMAWFTLRDYKLAFEFARNEPVLDAIVIAHALPRAQQVEIEGQFTLEVTRAPLRKFDVQLPPSIAGLLHVDSPLVGERSQDAATGIWHFTLRKELLGCANIRFHLSLPVESGSATADSELGTLTSVLPQFALPGARHFNGQWVIEANTATELTYATKGVQSVDALRASAVEGYQPRHRILAAFSYTAAAHEVKITATRHEPSALISAVVEQMNLTSVLSADGSSRHQAALLVKHNGQQFFSVRLPKGAQLLAAMADNEAVKPVRAGDDEVRVPLNGGSSESGAVPVKIIYELAAAQWGESGKHRLEPPLVSDEVPVLSANWRVYSPDGMEIKTEGGLEVKKIEQYPSLIGAIGNLITFRQKYAASGKLVVGLQVNPSSVVSNMMPQDFYGIQEDILTSAELHRRALERLKGEHPELIGKNIEIVTKQTHGSSIMNVHAICEDKIYAAYFVDALLVEYVGFRWEMLEAAQRGNKGNDNENCLVMDLVQIMERPVLPKIKDDSDAEPTNATPGAQFNFNLGYKFGDAAASTPITAGNRSGSAAVTPNAIDGLIAQQKALYTPPPAVVPSQNSIPVNGRLFKNTETKSGLISLDLTLPITGRILNFSGHQKPEAITLTYQTWQRQMSKAVFWFLLGVVAFFFFGWRRPCVSTFLAVLLLTCVPLLGAMSWLHACNAVLAGWLAMFGIRLLWRIARWIEIKCAQVMGAPSAIRQSPSSAVLLLFSVFSFQFSAFSAEDVPDPAAHTVIVPYDGKKPPNVQQATRFYLDYAEFQRLWELAKENRRPAKPDDLDKGVNQEAIINSALYEAEIFEDRLHVNARLNVVTRGGKWVKLPLPFKADGLAISEVKLDNKTAALQDGAILIEEGRAHVVEVALDVRQNKGWRDAIVDLPQSAAGLLALTLPATDGRPDFGGQANLVTEENKNGLRVFTLPLGNNSKFSFVRRGFLRPAGDALPAIAETRSTLSILPHLERVESQITFTFTGTERDRFTLLLDPSLKPVSWDIPNLREWTWKEENGKLRADIQLMHPVADNYTVALGAERVMAAEEGARTAPSITGVAVKESSVFNFQSTNELQPKVEVIGGTERMEFTSELAPGMLGGGAYRLQRDGKLGYTVSLAEDRSSSRMESVFQVSAQKAEIIAAITLDTGRGPLRDAIIGVPVGFEVQTLAGSRVLSWHRDGDNLFVRFDFQPQRDAKLVLHVAKTLSQANAKWKLEPLKLPQFKKHEGTALIAVHAADDVKLEFDAADRKLSEVDPATIHAVVSVAPPLTVKRALKIEKMDWSATVALARQTPKFAVDAVLLAQATDDGLKFSQQVAVLIEQGALNRVTLRMPKDLPEARVLGPLVRDAQSKIVGDFRDYEVSFQSDVLDRVDFSMDFETPLEGEKVLPVLQMPEAGRMKKFFIVDNASSREMKTNAGGAVAAVKESLPSVPEGLLRPVFYRADEKSSVKLVFSQLESTVGNAAIITLAEITSALRPNGERMETVVYSLANRSLQFLPVKLPVDAELIEVSVGGQNVRADRAENSSRKTRDARREYLVPLIQMRPGELSQQVRLVYRLPAREKNLEARQELDDPELVGLSAERTLWNVWLPKKFVMKKFDGNMEEVPQVVIEDEKQMQRVSDAARLNRLLQSGSLGDRDVKEAWGNANKVLDEVKSYQAKKRSDAKPREVYKEKEGRDAKQEQQAQVYDNELEKQAETQNKLLSKNSETLSKGGKENPQARKNPGKDANANWSKQDSGQSLVTNSNTTYASNSLSNSRNVVAFNDNVQVDQGFLAPQGQKADSSGTNTYNGGTIVSGGVLQPQSQTSPNQSGAQQSLNITNNGRASQVANPKSSQPAELAAAKPQTEFEGTINYGSPIQNLATDALGSPVPAGKPQGLTKSGAGGINLMDASTVTTPSGQRTNTEVIREFIYPTEFNPPQLKPVGRVSLAVEVPLEGTVYHFRKLKDHALIEMDVKKPLESRQTNALWTLAGGGVVLLGIESLTRWRRKRKSVLI